MQRLLDELRELDERLMEVEAQLGEIARQSEICQRLQTIPGIGLIASTASPAQASGHRVRNLDANTSKWNIIIEIPRKARKNGLVISR